MEGGQDRDGFPAINQTLQRHAIFAESIACKIKKTVNYISTLAVSELLFFLVHTGIEREHLHHCLFSMPFSQNPNDFLLSVTSPIEVVILWVFMLEY